MLNALAFLPVDQVPAGMAYLRTVVPADADPLLQYFDESYVSGTVRRIAAAQPGGALVLRMRRIAPLFPPGLWNVQAATMVNNPRTNNIIEGWNSRFQHIIGHNHPTIWKLIIGLQMEQAHTETTVAQYAIGGLQHKRVRRSNVECQVRMQRLCGRYANGEIDMPTLLRAVAHNVVTF